VRLEVSTEPPIHNLIYEFLINMAFTMACPNFKKGLKMVFSPLGVKGCMQLEVATSPYTHRVAPCIGAPYNMEMAAAMGNATSATPQ
jgi:hypothetical protein